MTFLTLCLAPERSIGLRVQSTVGCFANFFSVAKVFVGLRKQFIKKLFPTWACAVDINKNNTSLSFVGQLLYCATGVKLLLPCVKSEGVTARLLDLPSVTLLSVADYGRLKLGVSRWATSVALMKVVDNYHTKQWK